MVDVSFVVPYIHEYPALIHTVFSIQNEMIDLPYSYDCGFLEHLTLKCIVSTASEVGEAFVCIDRA